MNDNLAATMRRLRNAQREVSERGLDAHQLRQVAVLAYADPRTVKSLLTGGPCLATTRARVRAAIEALGYGHLVRMP